MFPRNNFARERTKPACSVVIPNVSSLSPTPLFTSGLTNVRIGMCLYR